MCCTSTSRIFPIRDFTSVFFQQIGEYFSRFLGENSEQEIHQAKPQQQGIGLRYSRAIEDLLVGGWVAGCRGGGGGGRWEGGGDV